MMATFSILFGHCTWSCCVRLLLLMLHFGETPMNLDRLSDSSRTPKLSFASIYIRQRCSCPWTGTAIGEKNMNAFRFFVALVFVCLMFDIILLTNGLR